MAAKDTDAWDVQLESFNSSKSNMLKLFAAYCWRNGGNSHEQLHLKLEWPEFRICSTNRFSCGQVNGLGATGLTFLDWRAWDICI